MIWLNKIRWIVYTKSVCCHFKMLHRIKWSSLKSSHNRFSCWDPPHLTTFRAHFFSVLRLYSSGFCQCIAVVIYSSNQIIQMKIYMNECNNSNSNSNGRFENREDSIFVVFIHKYKFSQFTIYFSILYIDFCCQFK